MGDGMGLARSLGVCGLMLLPGLVAWLGGRRLANDDPCLVERLWALRHRVGAITAVAAAILLLALIARWARWQTAWWALPLLAVGCAIGGFPARRRLLGETWSLPAYLWFLGAWWIGSLGFWVLLSLTPILLSAWALQASTPIFVACSTALGLLLLAWNHWAAAIVKILVRARPLTDASLEPGFSPILQAARVAAPAVCRFGAPGSQLANAFALPSLVGNTVLFSSALLAQLRPEEIRAILAHEVAHLEHFAPGLRKWYAILVGVIVAGTVALPLALRLRPDSVGLVFSVWPLVVLAALLARVGQRQKQEAESDRRAVELCGDPESLITGLTRLHAIALVPRQWEARFEQSATHPSLARRIQAIRTTAGTVARPARPASRPFVAPDGATAVVLEPDALRYFTGLAPASDAPASDVLATAATIRRFRYADLVELRVAASGTGRPGLRWMEKARKRWTMPLPAEDVAAVRAALEAVEDAIGSLPRDPTGGRLIPARLFAAAGMALAVLPALHAVLVPALLAVIRPCAGTFVAMAVTLAATGALGLHGNASRDSFWLPFLVGTGAAFLAYRFRRDSKDAAAPSPGWVVGAMALSLLLAWGMWAADARGSVVRLVRAAGESRAAVALPLAFAALLTIERRRKASVAAPLLLAAAVAPVLVQGPWFLERFVRDPLLPGTDALPVEQMPPLPVFAELTVDGRGGDLRVAPGGARVAMRVYGHDITTRRPTTTFRIADRVGPPLSLAVEDLQFVSADTALTLADNDGPFQLQLRRLDAAGAPSSRSWTLPHLTEPQLAADPESGRWRVVGWGRGGAVECIEGAVGRDQLEAGRWDMPEGIVGEAAGELLVPGEHRAWIAREYGWMPLWGTAPWLLPASSYWPDTVIVFDADGRPPRALRSTADAACLEALPGRSGAVCAAYDGESTRLSSIEPVSGGVRAIGKVTGHYLLAGQDHSGRMVLRAARRDSAVIVVDPSRGRAGRLSIGRQKMYFDVAFTPGFLAVARFSPNEEAMRVTVFRMEQTGPTVFR